MIKMSELQEINNQVPAMPQQVNSEQLLTKAIESNASMDTIERMMDLRERINAENARAAFYQAMSKFQAECPVIQKSREVKGKGGSTRYKYASLEDIVSQVSPLLDKYGLSFTVDTEHKDGFIIAKCLVRHILGHESDSTFSVPIEKEAFMNEAQKAASAQSYAKRYAFMNAFGILTGDVDNDAQSMGGGVDVNDIYKRFAYLMATVLDNCQSIQVIKEGIMTDDYSTASEAWFELDDEIKKTLWVAPTKGGPFTTKEREVLKSTEFREAHYGTTLEEESE